MFNVRSRLFKLITTAFLTATVVGMGGHAIADLGELVHFNCRPQASNTLCELTHEPLIGGLHTQSLAKSDCIKTSVQSKRDLLGRSLDRLVLVTRSQGELPLTRNWSESANDQLLAQQDQLDRFLNTASANTVNIRTHRPGYLWIILGGLGIFSAIAGIKLWQPKSWQRKQSSNKK